MNNKIFATLVVLLLLCKSSTLTAGGAHGKAQRLQEEEQKKRFLQAKALSDATATGNLKELKAMLARGIDVNMPGEYGVTALMVAVMWRRPRSMHLLVTHGACVNQTDDSGHSAVTRILMGDNKEEERKSVLRFLLKNSRCTHPVKTLKFEKNPEEILASLQAIDADYARKQATFLAEGIEAVEDERRATVAEVVLMSQRIFPIHSEINDTILSYVSFFSKETTLEERAHTLANLPNQY